MAPVKLPYCRRVRACRPPASTGASRARCRTWRCSADARWASTCAKKISTSNGNLQGHRRHVVVGRRVGAELLNRCEDRVYDFARALLTRRGHHGEEALGAEFAAQRVIRLEHAVAAEYVHVAGGQLERHFIVG